MKLGFGNRTFEREIKQKEAFFLDWFLQRELGICTNEVESEKNRMQGKKLSIWRQ